MKRTKKTVDDLNTFDDYGFKMFDTLKQLQETEAKEQINHPSHYGGDTTYEAIKVIEAWNLDFYVGNAAKYMCRAGKKGSETELKDLEKAAWYLNYKINLLKK